MKIIEWSFFHLLLQLLIMLKNPRNVDHLTLLSIRKLKTPLNK
jgi:hypothetical protein